MNAPYPWLTGLWEKLLNMRARLPHSVLLAGPRGVGKLELANAWAKSLLCENPTVEGEACGTCEACHWFDAGTHPDFMHMTLLEKETREGEIKQATEISVEQARQAVEFVQLSTYRAGRRVVLVEPAEALNMASANALLKVLEEPPINTIFILVSHQYRQLLPTILSRCHKLEAGLPERSELKPWLQENRLNELALAWSSGAPLAALDASQSGELELRQELLKVFASPKTLDCTSIAEAWNKKLSARLWHQISYKWLLDMISCTLGGKAGFNPDYEKPLQALARQVRLPALLELSGQESQAGKWVDHPLNRQMAMESWLSRYHAMF